MKKIIFLFFFIPYAYASNMSSQAFFYVNSIDNSLSEARLSGFGADLNLDYSLDPSLTAYISAGVRLEYGSQKASFISEHSPDQELILNYSYLKYTPVSFLEIDLGGLNQNYYKNPLFLSDVVFLGARETLNFNLGNFKFFISAQQAIPNNQSLSNRLSVVDKGTPKFFAETIGLEFDNNYFKTTLAGTSYGYESLSNTVAHQSRFMGNLVNGAGESDAAFLFNYQGINITGDLEFFFNDHYTTRVYAAYVKNDKATDGQDAGRLIGADFKFDSIVAKLETFKNESDTSVAYYNNKYYGHNNSEGYHFNIKIEASKSLNYSLSYLTTELVEANSLQDDSQVILFKLQKALNL